VIDPYQKTDLPLMRSYLILIKIKFVSLLHYSFNIYFFENVRLNEGERNAI